MSNLSKFKHSLIKRFIRLRIIKYRILSTCSNISGQINEIQPVLLTGQGRIIFGNQINFGVQTSPYFYSNYAYLKARHPQSFIQFGNNIWFNNSVSIISEGPDGIRIGNSVIAGFQVEIIDSDFHDLHPKKRIKGGCVKTAPIVIEDNVFLGNHVKILKGVSIGENSIIGNGSIVTKSIPANVIAGGYPAKIIRDL
jgi:maltose O-acetyltransferase